MMDTIEAISINYEEDGILIVKEIEKEVISKKGAFVTVLFRYQDWQAKKEEYSEDKFAIRRFQKRNGEYKAIAKFSLTDTAQAKELIETLSKWIA